jgi:SAM-dependent methyltransferase
VFDNYKDIFNARGAAYHQAMIEQPFAREQEFRTMLRLAHPADDQVIVDMPSGGGYLRHFIDADTDVTLLCVETSQAFADRVPRTARVRPILSELHDVPVDGGSVDTVVSMAGLHHVADRPAVFAEMRRLLKPAGRACIADVTAGSRVATFRNGFVNRHSGMGHHGHFIDVTVRSELTRAGFHITSDVMEQYHWTFPTEQSLARFCKLMFGLDRADEQQTLDGIREHVGYDYVDGVWRMNWELTFLEAVRV